MLLRYLAVRTAALVVDYYWSVACHDGDMRRAVTHTLDTLEYTKSIRRDTEGHGETRRDTEGCEGSRRVAAGGGEMLEAHLHGLQGAFKGPQSPQYTIFTTTHYVHDTHTIIKINKKIILVFAG